jgi:hypothetical protein
VLISAWRVFALQFSHFISVAHCCCQKFMHFFYVPGQCVNTKFETCLLTVSLIPWICWVLSWACFLNVAWRNHLDTVGRYFRYIAEDLCCLWGRDSIFKYYFYTDLFVYGYVFPVVCATCATNHMSRVVLMSNDSYQSYTHVTLHMTPFKMY